MIWRDVLVEREASAADVRQAIVAAGLATDVDVVEVVDSMETLERRPNVRVVCERSMRSGEFPLQLAIYVYDEAPKDTLVAATGLAVFLRARCLISSESEDPYRMVLVTPGSEPQEVELDVEALDDREEYVLAGAVRVDA